MGFLDRQRFTGLFKVLSKRDLFKASYFMAILSAVRLLVNLILGKLISLWIGATGLYYFGQLQSVMLITQGLSNGATNNGIIKYWVDSEDSPTRRKQLLSTVFSLGIFCSLIVGIILIIFQFSLSRYIFGSGDQHIQLVFLGGTLVFTGFNQTMQSIFNAQKKYRQISVVNNAQSFCLMLMVAVLTFYYKLFGALLALSVFQVLTFLVTVFIYRKDWSSIVKTIQLKIEWTVLKKLLGFSLMAIGSALIIGVTQVILRKMIAGQVSDYAAGLWEALNRISNLYIFFLGYLFTSHFLPKFAANKKAKLIVQQLKQGWKYLTGLFIAIAIALYPFRLFLIKMVFSDEFLPIASLLLFQIAGDYLKSLAWLFTNYLAALEKFRAFLFFEFAGNLLLLVLSYWCIPVFGLKGVLYTYMLSWLIILLVLFVYFKLILLLKQEKVTEI